MRRWRGTFTLGLVTAAAYLTLAGCSDSTGPGANGVFRRSQSLREDSMPARADSIRAAAPFNVMWRARSSDTTWLRITKDSGMSTAFVTWQVDPSILLPGSYVDTIRIIRDDSGPELRVIDSLEIRAAPSKYIIVHRAWRAGERDSTIAAMVANGVLLGFSDSSFIARLLDTSFTTQVQLNPLYPGGTAAAAQNAFIVMAPDSAGMTDIGLDVFSVDQTGTPWDTITTQYLFWYKTATPTYKGYAVIDLGTAATGGPDNLVNTTWDANGGQGTTGGGGEINSATGAYFEWSAGTFQITANSARTGTQSTISSGPYTGGTQASGLQGGRIRNGVLSRLLPTTGVSQSVSLDWRNPSSNNIPSAYLVCWYRETISGPQCNPASSAPAAVHPSPADARKLKAMIAEQRQTRRMLQSR